MIKSNTNNREAVIGSLMKGVKTRTTKTCPACSKDGIEQGQVCSGMF